MKTLKYILFALVLFGLWVTEPIWRNLDTFTSTPVTDEYDTPTAAMDEDDTPTAIMDEYDTSISNVDEHMVAQKVKNNEEVNVESRFLKKLALKYGSRPSVKESTGVPSSVYRYWKQTLQFPDSLQDETCSPIRGTEMGWTTVCRYRVKISYDNLELREDRFIIKNGTAYKK